MVIALSHAALGGPRRCPSRARSGAPLSSLQRDAAGHLLDISRLYLAPGAAASARAARTHRFVQCAASLAEAPIGSTFEPDLLSPPSRLDPRRAVFAKRQTSFDPTPYLGVFSAAAYLEPDLLSLDRLPQHVRPPAVDLPPPQQQRGATSDVLAFMWQWDRHGRLHLEPPWMTPRSEQGSLFPVWKSDTEDRVVFNRIPRNSKEFHLPGHAKFTVGGHELCEIQVPPNSQMRLFSDDLSDAFPSFVASKARARSNALAWTAPAEQFRGTAAHSQMEAAYRRAGRVMPSRLRPCHAGLPMGDVNAAEWCCEAHTRVLQDAGSLQPAVQLANGRPTPRGGLVEALVLDDHLGVAIDPFGTDANARAMQESFDRAGAAYQKVGLLRNEAKARRFATSGVHLGAEFLPNSTWLGAERSRRQALSWASLELARHGRVTRSLLRQLISTWIHVLLYRRVLLSFISSIFAFLGPVTDCERTVVALPASVRMELKYLACLAPAMCSDLGAGWHHSVLATDASHYGLGACSAPLDARLQSELWRHRDRRGAYTRIYSQWVTKLHLAGCREATDELEDDVFGTRPSPARVLIETFDYVELCCGANAPLMQAMAAANFRLGPKIDVLANKFWDLGCTRVVEWLLFLAAHDRVWHWHSCVPSMDFSIAKHPTCRSSHVPWGTDIYDMKRNAANFLLAVACCVMLCVSRSRVAHATHEHPASAYSWKVPFWKSMVARGACEIGRFSACQFGASFRKDTRLARVRAEFLRPLDRPCVCGVPHAARLEGGRDEGAAEYLPAFCQEFAALARGQFDVEMPSLGAADAESVTKDVCVANEMLWVNDLARDLPWRVTRSSPDPVDDHINVKELRAALGEAARVALRGPSGIRILLLVDSKVTIGAAAKGRSASRLLNRELRRFAATFVARGVYVGLLFVPTRLQPSDGASRLRAEAPRDGRLPRWAVHLLRGDATKFDWLTSLPRQPREASSWATLVCRFVELGLLRLSPKQRPRDGTLGYPGEGPAPARRPPLEQRQVDIRHYRNLTPVVAARRERLRYEFGAFIGLTFSVPLHVFMLSAPAVIDRALAHYGQLMFAAGRSLLDFNELINGIVDIRRELRGRVATAWDAAWVWKSLLPSRSRTPLPAVALQAMLATALSWRWYDVALLLGIGFLGLLRVHELRGLCAMDVLTPQRLLSDAGSPAFVVIGKPKMRRVTARRTYVRIDDGGFIDFMEAMVAVIPVEAPLFSGTFARMRRAFEAICSELGLPLSGCMALSWASLRPGGATWMFERTQDPALVRLRGRWASARMLEIYIQEVGAVSLLPSLAEEARTKIRRLATLAPGLLAEATAYLQQSTRRSG